MGGLALPPTCFTLSSKTKRRNFPNLSRMSPGSAWPPHPHTHWMGLQGPRAPASAGHPPPREPGPIPPPWDEVFQLPRIPASLGLDTRGLQEPPSAGPPFSFGLSGGGDPFGKEQKPSVVWATSPQRRRKSLCSLPWGASAHGVPVPVGQVVSLPSRPCEREEDACGEAIAERAGLEGGWGQADEEEEAWLGGRHRV